MTATLRASVLDKGHVVFIEAWGSDERIIESARMSTQRGFEGWGPRHDASCKLADPYREVGMPAKCSCQPKEGDERLLRYLWEHRHHTPFEMAGMTIEVKAPIFVFREWHRHRTQSYNEMSARYSPLPDEDYVPTVERVLASAGRNKQAQGTGAELTQEAARQFIGSLRDHQAMAQARYEAALIAGVPKELARLVLPVSRYSRMRASANLRNWLGFLSLRLDPAAQWEIRQYAEAVAALARHRFTRTMALFDGERAVT